MEIIDSIKHPALATLKELGTASRRRELGKCPLHGPSLIAQAREQGIMIAEVLVPIGETPPDNMPFAWVKPSTLKQVVGGSKPPEAVAIASFATAGNVQYINPASDLLIVLDTIVDPGNVGTIIRSALALGAQGVVITAGTADPFSRKVTEAARATNLRSTLYFAEDGAVAIAALHAAGYSALALAPRGARKILDIPQRDKIALIMGNESLGLHESVIAHADFAITQPMYAGVESLNVAVSAGIALSEARHALDAYRSDVE